MEAVMNKAEAERAIAEVNASGRGRPRVYRTRFPVVTHRGEIPAALATRRPFIIDSSVYVMTPARRSVELAIREVEDL
jgi:hypothetical protein